MEPFQKALTIYLLLVNALGFLLMHIDKQKAIRKRWRIPEATLMSAAALGGSAGALAGMYVFHHKTKHPKFYIGIPLILVMQLLLVGWAFVRVGWIPLP